MQLADDPSKNASQLNHGQREFFKHVVSTWEQHLQASAAVHVVVQPGWSTARQIKAVRRESGVACIARGLGCTKCGAIDLALMETLVVCILVHFRSLVLFAVVRKH